MSSRQQHDDNNDGGNRLDLPGGRETDKRKSNGCPAGVHDGPPDLPQAREALRDALDGIRSSGDFCTFDTFSNMADPQLLIDDGVPISLPLREHDARRIVALSHEAPFGKGTETLIDPTVRKTWELNADQFSMQNPEHNADLQEALDACVAGLGLAGGYEVTAQLYKLLLYEKGALFRPHTDTEKVPGMFATMIVVLPSAHEGGRLELSHNGRKVQFDSSERAQGAYGAWFSDVTHEVKEITSGYRLVLTYNLVHDGPAIHPSAANLAQQLLPLEQALKNWSVAVRAAKRKESAVYMLEHKYTDASLRLDALKGSDLVRAKAIEHLTKDNGFVLYLASMEKYIHFADEDGPGFYGYNCRGREYHGPVRDEYEAWLKLNRLVDVNGVQVGSAISIEENEILQHDPFGTRAPTERMHEPYTGNAGATSSYWYRDTVLVIWKREHKMDLLMKSFTSNSFRDLNVKKPDISAFLDQHLEIMRRHADDRLAKRDVMSICAHIVDGNINRRWRFSTFSDEAVNKVVVALIRMRYSHEKLLLAIKALSANGRLSSETFKEIGLNLRAYGPGQNQVLDLVIRPAIEKYSTLGGRFDALESLFGQGLERAKRPSAKRLAVELLTQAFNNQEHFDQGDAVALAGMSIFLVIREATHISFKSSILPKVVSNVRNSAAVISFLQAWLPRAWPLFGREFTASVLQQLWRPLITHFHIDRAAQESRPGTRQHTAASTTASDDRIARDLAGLLEITSEGSVPVDCRELIESIRDDSMRMDVTTCRQILVPFLRYALAWAATAIEDERIATSLRKMYSTGFDVLLISYVGKQPQEGGGFSYARLRCECDLCWHVNEFLVSDTEQRAKFAMHKNDRYHVHTYLDLAGFDGTHETERTYREPQTLVVTKRNRQGRKYDAWLARCREAHEELSSFDEAALEKVVSLTEMKEVKAMRIIVPDPARAPDFLPRYAPEAVPQPTAGKAGVKRKAEVIDLGGDSD